MFLKIVCSFFAGLFIASISVALGFNMYSLVFWTITAPTCLVSGVAISILMD